MRYRLGLPVFLSPGPCIACGRHSDILGDHSLGCGQQSERIARHDSLRDVLFQAACQAGLAPVREERNLLTVQEDRVEQRPGDILVKCWKDRVFFTGPPHNVRVVKPILYCFGGLTKPLFLLWWVGGTLSL